MHRESAVDLDLYETLRWTENPEDYVRRSLSRALFEDGQLEEVVGGAAMDAATAELAKSVVAQLASYARARSGWHAVMSRREGPS